MDHEKYSHDQTFSPGKQSLKKSRVASGTYPVIYR